MSAVTVGDLGDLLNAFRAALEGTCSPSTSRIPAELSGYFVDPGTGTRRPLGSTRQLLLREFEDKGALTTLERSVISLYFGLNLAKLPATSTRGKHSIASLLPPQPSSSGRPRTRDHDVLGANGVRYVRSNALEKLASTWRPLPLDSPVPAENEPDPLGSPWFAELTHRFSREQLDAIILLALRRARLNCGPSPQIRRQLWLDLDWWEYRSRLSPLSGYGVGRPPTPINRERSARACARISIALWDVLSASATRPSPPGAQAFRKPRRADGPAREPILRPPAEIQDLIMLQDESEAALTAIGNLERQVQEGLSDPDTAYLLAWLEPYVLRRLSLLDCGRGAAVLTRAAADHADLTVLGLSWFEAALARRTPDLYLAEAALNLSVAFSSRRRYREAQEILDRLTPVVRNDRHAGVLLRIGQSAWRRRILSEALQSGRGFDGQRLRETSRTAIEQASEALQILTPDEGRHPIPFLRTEIRLAEALALTMALLERSAGDRRALAGMLRSNAVRLQENAERAMAMRRQEAVPSAYDEARLEVIGDVASHLDAGGQIISFGVLRRVRAIQNRTGS